jgi:hypothetical protein
MLARGTGKCNKKGTIQLSENKGDGSQYCTKQADEHYMQVLRQAQQPALLWAWQ